MVIKTNNNDNSTPISINNYHQKFFVGNDDGHIVVGEWLGQCKIYILRTLVQRERSVVDNGETFSIESARPTFLNSLSVQHVLPLHARRRRQPVALLETGDLHFLPSDFYCDSLGCCPKRVDWTLYMAHIVRGRVLRASVLVYNLPGSHLFLH